MTMMNNELGKQCGWSAVTSQSEESASKVEEEADPELGGVQVNAAGVQVNAADEEIDSGEAVCHDPPVAVEIQL